MRRSSCTICTMRRPAMRASTRRRESTAGIAALVGRPMPSASTIDAIVDAVPIVMQWPAERDMHDSTSTMSSGFISPVLSISVTCQTIVPGTDVLAAVLAVQHRAAGYADRRQVARRRAHQERRRRLVASHEQHDAVERIGADRFLDVHRRLVAEEHRGRAHQRLAEAHHGKLDGEAARIEHAVAHVLRQLAEMRVARRGLRPRVADADHRAAVELVVRNALVLHPRAMRDRVAVLAAEPFGGAELLFRRHVGSVEITRPACCRCPGRIRGLCPASPRGRRDRPD